jgi:hypothetical protein
VDLFQPVREQRREKAMKMTMIQVLPVVMERRRAVRPALRTACLVRGKVFAIAGISDVVA